MIAKEDCRVLVVDDHAITADMMAKSIGAVGYPTQAAYTAGEAFAAMNTFHPAVVVLDLSMPWVSGEEIAKTIRAQGSRVLLIAVSGVRGDTRALADIGFDYFLRKPVPAEIVIDLIEMHCIAGGSVRGG